MKVLVGRERGVCLRVFILLRDLVIVDKLRCFRAVSEYKKVLLCWDGEEGWVYQPTSAAGARYLLKGTKVDFAGKADRHFDSYSQIGPIYVIFDRSNKERYTVQPSSHMAVNSSDTRVDMDSLPDWAQSHLA